MYEFIPPVDEEVDAPLTPPFRKLLANRGISFENLNIKRSYNPFNMSGMREAVDRILFSIRKGEKVLVHGDYDADGITSLALLYRVLKDFGIKPIPYIPSRFSEGYGFSGKAVDVAKRMGVKLIITVDCGISSQKEVDMAKSLGIDVVITDHHMKPDKVPDTIIVHPEGYENDKLTGVGVAFKLAHAMYMELGKWEYAKKRLYNFLDLFAVGTVADSGELTGENRLLVKHGLNILSRNFTKAGFKAIYRSASISPPIKTWHISYIIAPRLNAAGRIETAMKSFELLTKIKGKDVIKYADEIEMLNRKRQKIQNKIFEMLMSQVEDDEPIIFVQGDKLHDGVIGIVASKMVDKFARPAFVISINDDVARGSARGIEPFNVFESLNAASGLFENYGGHSLAGGFTIKTSLIGNLKSHLVDFARRVAPEGFRKKLKIDTEIYDNDLFSEGFWKDKDFLEPYGSGFPEPIFILKTTGRKIISGDGTSMVIICDEGSLFFSLKERVNGRGDPVITNLRVSKDGNIYGDVLGEV